MASSGHCLRDSYLLPESSMCHAGDWLKYELIDEQTQSKLTAAAWGGLVAHLGVAVYGATDCFQNHAAETRGQSAREVLTALAAVRGFLVGAMELARVIALKRVREAKAG